MRRLYIGIDNGTTGTIGVISDKFNLIFKVPVFKSQDYTKVKKNITRINAVELQNELNTLIQGANLNPYDCFTLIERQMINPARFSSSISASRALESVLCVIELLKITYKFIY